MNSHTLKDKSDLHLARKIWHFLGVILIVVVYHNVTRPVALQMITLFGSAVIIFDLVRQHNKGIGEFAIRFFGPVMRKSEINRLTGSSYLMLGVFIIVALFPTEVVKLSLFFLATADPIASYFGVRFGRDRLLGNKSLQGTVAAFTVCVLVSFFYYLSEGLMTDRLLMVSVLSGLAGAFSELVPIGPLDDNLILPVMSSGLLYGIFYLFGGF